MSKRRVPLTPERIAQLRELGRQPRHRKLRRPEFQVLRYFYLAQHIEQLLPFTPLPSPSMVRPRR
jgi:hypothetical protein